MFIDLYNLKASLFKSMLNYLLQKIRKGIFCLIALTKDSCVTAYAYCPLYISRWNDKFYDRVITFTKRGIQEYQKQYL